MNAGGVPNTCKSSGKAPSGVHERRTVSNAWVIYLEVGDSFGKPEVIPHEVQTAQADWKKDGDLRTCRFQMSPRPISLLVG